MCLLFPQFFNVFLLSVIKSSIVISWDFYVSKTSCWHIWTFSVLHHSVLWTKQFLQVDKSFLSECICIHVNKCRSYIWWQKMCIIQFCLMLESQWWHAHSAIGLSVLSWHKVSCVCCDCGFKLTHEAKCRETDRQTDSYSFTIYIDEFFFFQTFYSIY